MKRRRHRRRVSGWRRLATCGLALLVLASVLLLRCGPVITDFAESTAEWIAEKTANEVVAEVLATYADVSDTLIRVNSTADNRPSDVVVDSVAVNTIKTAITTGIMKRMDDLTTMPVLIPLGTLLGFDWLSGWGPLISFSIGVNASVLSTVSSALTAVGINQSAYRLSVNLTISLCVISPRGRSFVTVNPSFPMAETVLLGEVPGTLTEVNGDNRSDLEKIFDYGTTQ